MHVDACDATRVRGEQTEELLELRVACLGDRFADMRALGDVLAHADADVVRNGPAAVLALTPLRGCGDALALRAIERPPARSLAVLGEKEVVAGLAVQTTDPASRRGTSSTKLRSHWLSFAGEMSP